MTKFPLKDWRIKILFHQTLTYTTWRSSSRHEITNYNIHITISNHFSAFGTDFFSDFNTISFVNW